MIMFMTLVNACDKLGMLVSKTVWFMAFYWEDVSTTRDYNLIKSLVDGTFSH